MTDHDELLLLRELVKKQQLELNKKEYTISAQSARLAEQTAEIERQRNQIENLTQALLQARKKLFGASSETTKQIEGQLHLFKTVEELAKELYNDQQKITVKDYQREPRKAGVRAEMLESLPKEIVEYIIAETDTCTICGSDLKVIGKKVVRTEVEYIPAKLKVVQIVQQVAKCTSCGTALSEQPKDHFQKAAVPSPVLSHSMATASLVAEVLYQKFQMGVPFNRQERDWYRHGLILPRSSMAHWTIRCGDQWLRPIYDRIHEYLLRCECLHMDETRIQCNKEAGKKASSDSFMWVIRSGASEDMKATFFHYSRTRSGDVARNLLKGFYGYLTTDAYVGYDKVENIRRNLCWSHVRRYHIESIPLDNKGKEIGGSKGAEARDLIDLLFKLEKTMKDLPAEDRKRVRQEKAKPILDTYWTWVDETSALSTTNEKLTSSLTYARNQKKHLNTFMEDGRLPITNNLCEANIKPYATGRKSWLFADTPKGAEATAILYTLVESAKINQLNVYEYLKHILMEMPNVDFYNYPEIIDRYLPWSEELPEVCRFENHIRKRLK